MGIATAHAGMTEFCIIGGGMAGVSIAYHLSRSSAVILLEREPRLGSHSTGRSAALYSEIPMTDVVRRLSRLSRPFFDLPPAEFDATLMQPPRGSILTAQAADLAQLQDLASENSSLQWLDTDALRARVPILRLGPDAIVAGLLEPAAYRIDVAALLEGFRRGAKARGADIRSNCGVRGLHRAAGCWSIATTAGESLRASVIVNAAGSWGDEIATLAGAAPLGLTPLRRTMIVFDPPPSLDCRLWPAVGGADASYYFLPDAGLLMGSAADEVPSPPCDAQPEPVEIALAAQRIEDVTTLTIKRIRNRWAGLRTFAPDRLPVAGYDPVTAGFFWLVGQGGSGIQTAPALGEAAAALALRQTLPDHFLQAGISAGILSPARFTSN